MENNDYILYYTEEDILIVYSFEDETLREDTYYGFDNACQNIMTDTPFWSVNWDVVGGVRHKVLLSDYSKEEFIENFAKNDHFLSFDYENKYTVQDVLNKIYEEL